MHTMNRKFYATAAALSLAAGLAACSDDGDGAAESTTTQTQTSSAETTTTATRTSASTSGAASEAETQASSSVSSSPAGSAAPSESPVPRSTAAANPPAGGAATTAEIALADGSTALVPQGVIDTIDKYGDASWGQPTAVEQVDGGWVMSFDGAHYTTWKDGVGGAPVVGEIANSWLNDVRGARAVGFPTAPESENADGSGWSQQFERGTISWVRNGADSGYAPVVKETK